VHLVLRGARHIKDHFIYLLSQAGDLPQQQAVAAVRLVSDTIDLAMEIMGHAYSVSHDRNSRAEEAYRLFAITQNITNEKDQQKAALLDWENQLMFEQAVGHSAAHLPRICRSEFGLWLRHKAVHAFEGSAEIELVLDTMEQIDDVILPLFSAPSADQNSELSRIQLLRDLREKVKSIRFHMDNLFDQNNELEAGRDVLTRLLNRKFLPVVLTKQIANAKARHSSFAVLMVDIDYFKQVNDTYGHQAGDSVLQQLALILVNNSRSGDYLFRLGGEEFMLVLVDTDVTGARPMAEKLRKSVEQEAFLLPQGQKVHLTVSIGAACFDGHPDYMHLLHKADEALYQVKNNGRNQVIIAG
jgi:diguanylate cyclase